MRAPLMVVNFGAGGERPGGHNGDGVSGGDLFQRKLLPGYFRFFLDDPTLFPQKIVLADPTRVQSAASYLEHVASINRGQSALLAQRHSQHGSEWKEFLERFVHVPTGDSVESAVHVYAQIRDFKQQFPTGRILFYLSITYTKNLYVMQQIQHIVKELGCYGDTYVLFEKPAYLNYRTGAALRKLVINSGIQIGRAQQVEHFLPRLRTTLKHFEEFAYHEPGHNILLNSKGVDSVRIRMIEPVGSEGRLDYPGTLGDSGPHIAAVLGLVLGDPRPFSPESEAILQRVEGLLPRRDLPDDADDGLLRETARACYDSLRLRGIYACCDEDHCEPHHVPTGCYMQMFPRSLEGARWNGTTKFVIQHQKCGPRGPEVADWDASLAHRYGNEIRTGKCYEISYQLKWDPAAGAPAEWRFVFDGRIPGVKEARWWWTKTAIRGSLREQYDFSGFREMPKECVDTYNGVVHSALLLRMEDFMPLRWQHAVDQLFIGGVARVLDKTDFWDIDNGPPGQRIWFRCGEDAFARPDIEDIAHDLSKLLANVEGHVMHVA